jgi:lysyl-tRNA synthetase, class II
MPERRPLRLERHRLGPRVFVFGLRVHEWHLGLAVAAGYALAIWTGLLHLHASGAIALPALAAWLVAKDWRDVFPSLRDTAGWQVGLHRSHPPLRDVSRFDSLPLIMGVLALLAAVANAVSAVFDGPWRDHLLFHLRPLSSIPVYHSLAVPIAVGSVLLAVSLLRRRRAAWAVALIGLLVVAAVEAARGDLREGLLSLGAAVVVWHGRGAFPVASDPGSLRTLVARLPTVVAVSLLGAGAALWLAAPDATPGSVVARETLQLLLWRQGSISYYDEAGVLPPLVKAAGLLILLCTAYIVFRRPQTARALPGPELRRAAAALVRAHGTDTLAFFKLRRDTHYLFGPERRAFLAYRIEAGTMLLSGDPVGPECELRELVREACSFAGRRGLKLGVVGANADTRSLFADAGLRGLYLGDEAIVDTGTFSLEGRSIRKVRQSVSRLDKAGYRVELHELRELSEVACARLEGLAAEWRRGAPERGFSMALDSLRGDHREETILVVAYDESDDPRGLLQFVPSYGRPAYSLSMMRRDLATPNGLTEFMIVRAIEQFRARGTAEISLNFAAFARWLREPRGLRERLLGRALGLADSYFQIESLYRFCLKFEPRWEPRYLLYEGIADLPRTGLAALWAEGQLAKPAAPRLRRPRPALAAE